MTFYSGFTLRDEAHFFEPYLYKNDFNVAGFSYGAIKALLHVMHSDRRVDTLQLFSPAFFQNRPETFKRLQLMGYKKDSEHYVTQFLKSCFMPHALKETLHVTHHANELQELLSYEWRETDLEVLVKRGVRIEIYLGAADAVIDAAAAKEFFLPFGTVYYINNANHFLLQE